MHSKYRSPNPARIIRRFLVVWNVSGERRALDKLAPEFLKQFHGWVDLQQVATPVLRVACGRMLGLSDVRMSLRDAMQATSFKPGFSLQTSPHQRGLAHDPGMDAVRILGVLARLMAYPIPDISSILQEMQAANYHNFHTSMLPLLKSVKSLYPCLIVISVETSDSETQPLPESIASCDGFLRLLRQAGLGEPQLLTMVRDSTCYDAQPRVCVYYDTLQRLNAAINALHAVSVDGNLLQAELCWNPNKAWHCVFSQVPAPLSRVQPLPKVNVEKGEQKDEKEEKEEKEEKKKKRAVRGVREKTEDGEHPQMTR
ncbi:MAG: hypothetical protein STHCBS139747_004366 [Sporothrix thermara]